MSILRRIFSLVLIGGLLVPATAQAHTPPDFDFYPTPWQGDLNVDWAFTTSVPTAFRQHIRLGAASWTDLPLSLSFPTSMKFVEGAPVADFNVFVCPEVYQKNAAHWVTFGPVADILSNVLGFAVLCDDGAGALESAQVAFLSTWYPAYDLWTVATHEFGHATGFVPHFRSSGGLYGKDAKRIQNGDEPYNDFSACPGNTMCPYYVPDNGETGRDPNIHDLHTFQNAYPPTGPTPFPTVPAVPPDPAPYDPWEPKSTPALPGWGMLGLTLLLGGIGLWFSGRSRHSSLG